MVLRRFDVHKAASVAEAVALRQRFGPDGALYAGGTELLLAMKLGVARWPQLIDLKPIAALGTLAVTKEVVRIGATVTHWDIERDPAVAKALPVFARLEANVANVRVRAVGTLAGNLAFAEPHADPPALLIALGACVVLEGPAGTRILPVRELLTGMYQTAIGPDELIVAIEIPLPAAGVRMAYLKFQVLERPSVGVALVATVRDGKFAGAPSLVIGAVDEVPRPVPAPQFAGADARHASTADGLVEAARAAVDPTDDLAGSAEYKRHVVGVFVRRALGELMAGAA